MRQRLSIAISGLVAAAVLTVGLTAAGFGPEARPAVAEEFEAAAAEEAPVAETAAEDTEPEIVYVKPAPKAKTVVVKKAVKQKSSGSAKQSNKQVRARSGDDDDDDDDEREREGAKKRQEREREAAKKRQEREREDEREDEDD